MAANDPNTKFVNFTFNWRIELSQYDQIRNTMFADGPRKYFITAFNNVVFRWYAYFRKSNAVDSTMIGFFIWYDDGPTETIKGAQYKIGIVKRDGSIRVIRTANTYDGQQGGGNGYDQFDDKDSAAIRTKYGLEESEPLVYNITMRIPTEAFSYSPSVGIPNPTRHHVVFSRHADRFQSIQDPESSQFYDAVLISRGDVEFYCHKVIISQTEPLETMFSDPLASLEEPESPIAERGTKRKGMESENDGTTSAIASSSTIRKTERGYKFKEMATSSLKALIEYLYTGQSTLTELTTTEIIQLADAAEQYLLKPLKELCIADLWKRVVIKPESAFEIVRFADLHGDCKHLKRRALDVMAENYQELGIKPISLAVRIAGTRGKELRNELMDYVAQRRCPYIGPW